MKAIIVPLNKFFFNFEKYDGSNVPQRFWRRHTKLQKLFSKKFFVTVFVLLPTSIFILFYFMPVYLWHYIKSGKKVALEKFGTAIESFQERAEKTKFLESKDIYPVLRKFHGNGYSIFVYYTSSMIPEKKKKQKMFFEKLELMKEKLNIKLVLEANGKEDIERTLQTFDVTVSESFFMTDGIIDLSNYPQLEESNL